MHLAAAWSNPEIFNTLTLYGIDMEDKDFYGRKPIEIIKTKHRRDIKKVIFILKKFWLILLLVASKEENHFEESQKGANLQEVYSV